MKNIAIILFISFSHLLFADIITTDTGQDYKDVVILEENYDKVYYYFKNGGINTKNSLDQSKVKEITRSEVPYGFTVAETYFDQKSYDQAIKDYEREARNKNWTEQHCYFRIAESYRLQGKLREAVGTYSDLMKNFRKGRYLPEAYYYMGECYLVSEQWRNAGRSYEKAARIYQKIKKQKEQADSNYKLAYTLEKSGAHSRAADIYKDLTRSKNNKDIAIKANLRLGICYLEQKEYRSAKKEFLDIIKDHEDSNILSTAYVGLGDYYLKGNIENDAKKALFCYLRVIMLYPGTSEDMLNAHNGAASSFKILGQNDRARNMEQQAAKWKN